MVDHRPEVTDGSLVERTLCGDVSLASSVVAGHVAGVDVVAVRRVRRSLQLHSAVVVRQQMWKPVELGVDWQLGDARRER